MNARRAVLFIGQEIAVYMLQIYVLEAPGRFYTRSLSASFQKNLSELDTFRCNSIVMLLGQDIRYVNNSRNNLPAHTHTHKIMEAWRSVGFSFSFGNLSHLRRNLTIMKQLFCLFRTKADQVTNYTHSSDSSARKRRLQQWKHVYL